jgi:hypothetical protein
MLFPEIDLDDVNYVHGLGTLMSRIIYLDMHLSSNGHSKSAMV